VPADEPVEVLHARDQKGLNGHVVQPTTGGTPGDGRPDTVPPAEGIVVGAAVLGVGAQLLHPHRLAGQQLGQRVLLRHRAGRDGCRRDHPGMRIDGEVLHVRGAERPCMSDQGDVGIGSTGVVEVRLMSRPIGRAGPPRRVSMD